MLKNINMMEFKDDLDIILKVPDISLRDLADELGFDAPTVSDWLTGKKGARQKKCG